MKRIAEQAGEVPGTRHVCIGDRELGLLALLVMVRKMNHAANYLVRCQHNRVLPEGGKLWDDVMTVAPLGRIRFEMSAGRGRKAARSSRMCAPSAWYWPTARVARWK